MLQDFFQLMHTYQVVGGDSGVFADSGANQLQCQ